MTAVGRKSNARKTYIHEYSINAFFYLIYLIFFLTAALFRGILIIIRLSLTLTAKFRSKTDSVAHLSIYNMKIGTILAFAIGLAGPYTTAAPSSALDGIVVKRHLNGFRTELHPVARLTSRASPIIINAPGVTDETQSVVSVYACSRRNFAGFCVFVRSFPDQCGE